MTLMHPALPHIGARQHAGASQQLIGNSPVVWLGAIQRVPCEDSRKGQRGGGRVFFIVVGEGGIALRVCLIPARRPLLLLELLPIVNHVLDRYGPRSARWGDDFNRNIERRRTTHKSLKKTRSQTAVT